MRPRAITIGVLTCVSASAWLAASASRPATASPPTSQAARQDARDRAASAPAPVGAGVLSGRVIVDVNGQPAPVRRARVTLDAGGRTAARTTDTDAEGVFHFTGLPDGRYLLSAAKPGFVLRQTIAGAPGLPIAVDVSAARPSIADAIMQPGAALEGRITTDAGDPASGVIVSAVRLTFGRYGKQPVAIAQAHTDDLGRYRIHTLPAGEYFISAAADPAVVATTPSAPGAQPPGIARAFYPGTAIVDEARSVTLGIGQNAGGLDLRLPLVTLVHVSGSVLDSTGQKPAMFGIRLQAVGAAPGGPSGFSVPSDTAFSYLNVPPGDYWMLASASHTIGGVPESAVRRITIGTADVNGLVLTTAPGANVHGQLAIEPGAPVPAGVRVSAEETAFELPAMRATDPRAQAAAASAAAEAPAGTVGPDGTFSFPSLAGPRIFRLNGAPAAWAIAKVTLDGAEVTDTPVNFAASDRDHQLRILVAAATGSVAGTVSGVEPASGPVRVIAFSEITQRWGVFSRVVKSVEVDPAHRFSIVGLLPGRYFVVAVEHVDAGAALDPEVLDRLRGQVTPIDVGAGRSDLTLTVRRLP